MLVIGWSASPAAEFFRSVLIGLAVAVPWGVAIALEERTRLKTPFSGMNSYLIVVIPGLVFVGFGTAPFLVVMSYGASVTLFGEIPHVLLKRFLAARKPVQQSAL